MPGRSRDQDAFVAALDDAAVGERRHALFGATPAALADLERVIGERHPGANVVAAVAPPFGGVDEVLTSEALDPLLSAEPDIVWVGLGTPLQDKVLGAALDHIPATLVAVGAAFDFLAETKPRAPLPVRRMKMEWAWRLSHEPRRLWKRYLVGGGSFVAGTLRERPARVASGGETQ